MKIRTLLIVPAVALALASCSSSEKTLYSWYKYEDVTYEYSKTPTDDRQAQVIEQYQKLIAKQKGTRKTVQPGLYAEYGFLLCKSGKVEEGVSYLKKEIELYPESELFISRIIKQFEE